MKRKRHPIEIRAQFLPGRGQNLAWKIGKDRYYKYAVQGPLMVAAEGGVSDVVCNRKHYGSSDQAIYATGSVDIDF